MYVDMETQSMSVEKQPDLQSSSGMTPSREKRLTGDRTTPCDDIFRGGVQENRTIKPPSDTTTAIIAQANTQCKSWRSD